MSAIPNLALPESRAARAERLPRTTAAADVRLTTEALKDAKVRNRVHVVSDGVEAMAFLRRQGRHDKAARPDLILLDLNLPKKDGREVLDEIKNDETLQHIPVVVLSTSAAEQDILRSYRLRANAYVTKPVDLDQFLKAEGWRSCGSKS